jgi:hypothetical protein
MRRIKQSVVLSALAVAWLSAAGCRSDANRELLEREMRDQEDQVYALQDQCNRLHAQLEACQRDNSALKGGAVPAMPAAPGLGREATPPSVAPPPPADIPIPKIDLGTPESPPPPPPSKKPEEGPTPQARRGSARPASLNSEPAGPVERIAINRLMTGGHSFSGKPADDGVLVVFAARDSSGRATQAPGDISIVVIDPEAPGPAARIARWDFLAPEAAAHYHQGPLVDAFHFELLWPKRPPEHGDLKLFVRLTSADGRRFEDSQPIHVRLPGSPEVREAWTTPGPRERWAPAQLPAGGQFDPEANHPESDRPAADSPRPAPAVAKQDSEPDRPSSEKDTAARPTERRRDWSPYR